VHQQRPWMLTHWHAPAYGTTNLGFPRSQKEQQGQQRVRTRTWPAEPSAKGGAGLFWNYSLEQRFWHPHRCKVGWRVAQKSTSQNAPPLDASCVVDTLSGRHSARCLVRKELGLAPRSSPPPISLILSALRIALDGALAPLLPAAERGTSSPDPFERPREATLSNAWSQSSSCSRAALLLGEPK